ncbi:MAG: cytochrome c [Hyphomicrobiales bacterium]|nr:cytochrome c [Hyphomicrobiales bacterium]
MSSKNKCIVALIVTALVAVSVQTPTSNAQETEMKMDEFGIGFLLSLGGKLYDNLWVTVDVDPPRYRNPAFPKEVAIDDGDTWRCVSCHGWDYRGIEGERAVLGRHEAFADLKSLSGTDPYMIMKKIRGSHPDFPQEAIPDFAFDILGLFISVGLYDRDSIIDNEGRAWGDLEQGRDIFEGACMNCHQPDGRAGFVGEKGDHSSLGWVARNRPEQALHKILNGVPGADMLAVGFLDFEQILNLFAYVQTLDREEK